MSPDSKTEPKAALPPEGATKADAQTARRFVPVAEVARPHGLRGELRLKLYNEGSELLTELARGAKRSPAVPLKLRLPSGEEQPLVLTSARSSNKALLVKFDGVVDCDAAELLRGAVILVPRDAFPPLEEGEFYACDIEGARAMVGEEQVGVVTELHSYPTCDVLVVKRDSTSIEVPLTDTYVASVDVAGGVVELVTIEGLA
ncbi:MAG: ribosome maturation factor RimM [Byssovorax sp.]